MKRMNLFVATLVAWTTFSHLLIAQDSAVETAQPEVALQITETWQRCVDARAIKANAEMVLQDAFAALQAATDRIASAEKRIAAVDEAIRALDKTRKAEVDALEQWRVAFNDLHMATTATPPTDPDVLTLLMEDEVKLKSLCAETKAATQAMIIQIRNDLALDTFEESAPYGEAQFALSLAKDLAEKEKGEAKDAIAEPTERVDKAEAGVKHAAEQVLNATLKLQSAYEAYGTYVQHQGNQKLDELIATVSTKDDATAKAIAELQKAIQNGAVATNNVAKQVVEVVHAVNGVGKEVHSLTAEVGKTTEAVDGVATEVKTLTTEVGKTTEAVQQIATEVSVLRADLKAQNDTAIAKIVATLTTLKAPEEVKATAEKLDVVVELPDEALKEVTATLTVIASKMDTLKSDDSATAEALRNIHELLQRFVAEGQGFKEAKAKEVEVRLDRCGRKCYLHPDGQWRYERPEN